MDENISDVDFQDFPYICRICLFKGDTKPFTQALRNVYNSLVNESVEEEDEMPRSLCSKCISKLEEIQVFIKRAIAGTRYLKEALLRHKNQIFVEEFDKDIKFEISDDDSLIDENDTVFSDDVKDEDSDDVKDEDSDDIKDEDSDEYSDTYGDESKQIESYQFHCKTCKNIFISVEDLNEHKKHCVLTCKTCGESFETSKQLDNHCKQTQNCQGAKRFGCNICHKRFAKRAMLKKHAVSHTNDTPYECKSCDKKFKFSQNLRRHDNIVHKGVKPFKCDVCGKDYPHYETLKGHIVNVHGLDVRKLKYQDDKYKRVIASHNGVDRKIIKRRGKRQTCDICFRKFSTTKTLKDHKVLHTGKKDFLCTICGKAFVRRLNLRLHFRIHTGEKPYECEICGKQFSQVTGYKRHSFVHSGERPYKCEFCNKAFTQSAHLNVHRKQHTNDRPFACTYCGKTFIFKHIWQAHERTHTGEKPFVCEYCNKGFYDQNTWSKHKKIHLRKSDVPN